MINFEEELKKFQPVLEVENVEEAVRERELTDLLGLLADGGAKADPEGDKEKA